MIVAPEVGSASVVETDVTVGMCGASSGGAVIAFCVSNSATRVATNSVGLGPAAEDVAGAEQAEAKMTNEKMTNEQWRGDRILSLVICHLLPLPQRPVNRRERIVGAGFEAGEFFEPRGGGLAVFDRGGIRAHVERRARQRGFGEIGRRT